MKRPDGSWMTKDDMAETIARQAESIRVLSIERDQWVDRYRSLEAMFTPVELPSEMNAERRAELHFQDAYEYIEKLRKRGTCQPDEIEEFARGLPV